MQHGRLPGVDVLADPHATTRRIDGAERASNLALWRAAAAAGHRVEIVDDGDLAIAAAPDVPGSAFNLGLGFADRPHLLWRARDHFAAHGVTGWAWSDTAPWAGAEPDSIAVYTAAAVDVVSSGDLPEGVVVRRLARDEVGPWGAIVEEAGGMDDRTARAFADSEAYLAREVDHHRFVAEVGGRPVGTGSLHVHRQVGWMRAGVVLTEARGRGIQRALIAARAVHARELGCDIVAASADADGASARNLERVGAQTVSVRGRYRLEPTAPLG